MLVTALSPVIGYDKASAIAHKALDENKTLREAALESGYIRAEEFDTMVMPAHMAGDPHKDLEETRKVLGLSGLKKEGKRYESGRLARGQDAGD